MGPDLQAVCPDLETRVFGLAFTSRVGCRVSQGPAILDCSPSGTSGDLACGPGSSGFHFPGGPVCVRCNNSAEGSPIQMGLYAP